MPHSPLLKAVTALCLGLALLCMLTRPGFVTLQELHEVEHAAVAGMQQPGSDSVDPVLEDIFHAPHCCAHAAMLPAALMLPAVALRQDPPRSVAASPRSPPPSRFLRPPIAV